MAASPHRSRSLASNRVRRRPAGGSRRPLIHKPRIVLGIMSGTSADGVDVVAARIAGSGEQMRVRYLARHHRPFSAALRRRVLAVMAPAQTTTEEICCLHAELGDLFGQAAVELVQKLGGRQQPSLIGLAGQTVCHLPGKTGQTVTLQLGDAARVAERTGLSVVSDFRQSDVAAGGQGAPLVPWTDWVLFRHPKIGRAIQNIGGIGNVTWIPPGASAAEVVAFDTGPGNMVIDGLVSRVTRGRHRLDRDGRRAARGRVLKKVLDRWMDHVYFRQPLPKTTGRELFGEGFIDSELPRLRAASHSSDDWVATATAFTARSIVDSYRRHLSYFDMDARGPNPRRAARAELVLCGGGARNRTLSDLIAAGLAEIRVRYIDSYGIPAEAKEGLSFAMLATACMDGCSSNLAQVTGAKRAVVLGRITGQPR